MRAPIRGLRRKQNRASQRRHIQSAGSRCPRNGFEPRWRPPTVTIVRIAPNYPADARKAFEEEGFSFVECPIVAVELNTEEDLPRVTLALLEAEINIHYLYPFLVRPGGKSALAMRVEDTDVAIETLSRRQVRVLSLEDIAR